MFSRVDVDVDRLSELLDIDIDPREHVQEWFLVSPVCSSVQHHSTSEVKSTEIGTK